MEEEDTERGPEPKEWEQDHPTLNDAAELSLNFVVGISTPKTMKLRGRVDYQEVVVLIDSGASHNFISTDLVEKLGIPSVGTHSFKVLMGTGLSVKGVGLCQGVKLQLLNIEVEDDVLPLKLGSADVIVGMEWFETLGGMRVNWKSLTMSFE